MVSADSDEPGYSGEDQDDEVNEVLLVFPGLLELFGTWSEILQQRQRRLEQFALDHLRTATIEILEGVGSIVVIGRNWRTVIAGLGPTRERWLLLEAASYWTQPGPSPTAGYLREIGIYSPAANRECPNVIVGVLDTGCWPSRDPALNVVHFIEFDSSGTMIGGPARDLAANEHGTNMCLRLAGAQGVAPRTPLAVAAVQSSSLRNPGVSVGGATRVARGLNWLVKTPFGAPDPGCDVINASLVAKTKPHTNSGPALAAKIALAQQKHKLIVCAVGNSPHAPPGILAGNPDCLAVGGLANVAAAWVWNNNNTHSTQKPEVCAPGPSTSDATPLVTGVCALHLQQSRITNKLFSVNGPQLKSSILQHRAPVMTPHPGLHCVKLKA